MVPVTVYVASAVTAVGVPVILHVAPSFATDNPVGNAGATVQLSTAPPVFTNVNGAITESFV